MRLPFSPKVNNQELKIEELVVRKVDIGLIAASTSSYSVVYIGEPLDSITEVMLCDDSASKVTLVQASALSIVNSQDYSVPYGTPPGTDGHGDGLTDAIKIMSSAAGSGTPGAPNLGGAAAFELLAYSAITSTGNTVITGDIGVFPTDSITGFPPGTVSGVIHHADAVAAAALVDAQAAYTDLAGRSATAITANLNGQTLTPGVYKETSGTFNLAASGNGTLILNGAGVYVFQCSSTLTTGAGGIPTITLSGGALAQDVYWICGSSATINSGSAGTFPGTIIATASVTDTLGGTVNGRLIGLNGAVTLSAATIGTVPSGSSGTGVSFNANDVFILKYITKN